MVKFHVRLALAIALCHIITLYLIYKCIPLNGTVSSTGSKVRLSTLIKNKTGFNSNKNGEKWRAEEAVFFKKIKAPETIEMGSVDDIWCNPDNPTRFSRVSNEIYLYSAYLDNRKQNEMATIRVIAAVDKAITKELLDTRLRCVFQINETTDVRVRIKSYEMCENHKKKFGGWILSCQVPRDVGPEVPDRVKITFVGDLNGTVDRFFTEVCVVSRDTNTVRRKLNFGVCVPPIYGSVTSKQLIEFIEFNRILGADMFTLYETDDLLPDIKRVIHYYKEQNIINSIQWRLPFPTASIWYHAQSLAINDCLYRNMNDFEYLTFVDLDEFIIPQGNMTTWYDVIDEIREDDPEEFKNTCALSFKSTFYAQEFSRHVFSNEISVVVRTNRTNHFSFRRHKLIVKPDAIFELGIHHVSKPFSDDVNNKVINVPWNKAHIHHYRACVQEFGIHCNVRINDYRIPNVYGKKIIDNYLKTVFDITP